LIFKSYIPSFPLSEYINSFIYYEGYNPDHNIDRFLPDGNTEIVIDLTGEAQYIYDNETLKEIQACHNVWVSGIRTEPISIPSGKHSKMLIITFKKGMAYPFYPLPLNELTDYVVDADLIFGKEIINLREKLLGAKTVDKLFLLIEKFLFNIGRNTINKNVNSKCVEFAVSTILNNPSELCLYDLSDKIGYSQKHFISLFKKQVGLTPKSYLKIIRFQKTIQDIESQSIVDWNSIAYKSGYYDQAHFINDFTRLSGFSPTEYIKKKNEQLNYIPVG